MEITISIRSFHDLKRFQRKLFFYRSLFCFFVHFTDNHSLIPIHSIIEALNIKNRKKRITYVYDFVCKQVDHYYQDKNLCDFSDGCCVVQRRSKKYHNGCCRLCKYCGPHGCTTSNFTCKLFYCYTAKSKNPEKVLSFDDFILLKCLSVRQRFLLRHDFFSSREQVIQDLWWESVFINLFRIYPRFISNIILKRR